jgi:hypothetical protein
MLPSGILHPVALVRTDVSEECITFVFSVKRFCDLGTTLAVTSNLVPRSPIIFAVMIEVIRSSEISVRTRATW